LPAGLLREPLSSLKRADAFVVTRCDQVSDAQAAKIEAKLRKINPRAPIARSTHLPVSVRTADDSEITPDELKTKKVFAFCGIGNPDAFLATVKKLSNLVGSRIFDDHHHYTEDCISSIQKEAKDLKADLILTTQKDRQSTQYAIRDAQYAPLFAYLAIEMKFITGLDELTALIEDALAGKMPQK